MLKKFYSLVIVLIFMLTGCGISFDSSLNDENEKADKQSEQYQYEVTGTGKIVYDFQEEETVLLHKSQENLILMSMFDYYDSLGQGKDIDNAYLFADDIGYREFKGIISVQMYLRNLLPENYRILDYEFTLRVINVLQKDDVVQVEVEEDSIEHFIGFPYLDSERYSTYHWIELVEIEDEWKIKRHVIFDTLRYSLFGEEDFNGENAEEYLAAIPSYLNDMENALNQRLLTKEEGVYGSETDYVYEREAALAYAEEYVAKRNEEWNDYSTFGGNCQNFASQCLFAAGIPMDTEGKYYWKYFGVGIANDSRRSGRSSSWTGVSAFVEYATNNRGYGLSAAVGYPFAWADEADLLIMGNSNKLRHTTMVARPVFDRNGARVDYLIYCNTMNMKNYPALLYGYPEMMIIHINGWNEPYENESVE